jgi:microcystin-dependent protein
MEAFTGEVRLVGFRYAPVGWALCDGTPLPVAQYGPLFQQIGYRFGGSGGTFNLPDLRDGQIAIGAGTGPGLTPRKVGERGGAAGVTLTAAEMPPHAHSVMTTLDPGDVNKPAAATALARSNGKAAYHAPANLKSLDASSARRPAATARRTRTGCPTRRCATASVSKASARRPDTPIGCDAGGPR